MEIKVAVVVRGHLHAVGEEVRAEAGARGRETLAEGNLERRL
jgi:hypothetical protein